MQADQLTTHRISPGLMHTGVDPVQVLHRSAVALNFQHQAPDIRIGISPPDFTQLILCHGLEGGQIATVHVHGRGLTTVWIYTILSGCRRDFICQVDFTLPGFILGYTKGIYREVSMEQGSVFLINRTQAVRLPKAVALPEDVKRVDIVAVGRARIIVPAGQSWDSWFEGEGVTDDFMSQREQPADQEREEF